MASYITFVDAQDIGCDSKPLFPYHAPLLLGSLDNKGVGSYSLTIGNRCAMRGGC